MKIELLQEGLNVQPLVHALNCHPELWNRDNERTVFEFSPHAEIHDIYVRYAEPDVNPALPHFATWYPAAAVLPIKPLCFDLMRAFEGTILGGVLITKIPAGKSVKPHVDTHWHAQFYSKFAVQLQAHPKQAFCFEDQELVTKAGDLYTFNNSHKHWVTNESDVDRITLIVCLRRED